MLTRKSTFLVGQGREEIHPLMNPAILRNIFGNLNVDSLKSVRQSCSFWKEEANSLLQNKSKVTILWYNHANPCVCKSCFLRRLDVENTHTLGTFMKYVESVRPENVFYRNYVLIDWCLHSKQEEMTQFWLQCGQHIRNLSLESFTEDAHFGFYEGSYVRNVFFKWTPNMESLDINTVRFMNVENYTPPGIVRYTQGVMDPKEYKKYVKEKKAKRGQNVVLGPMKKFEMLGDIRPNYNLKTFRMEPSQKYPDFPLRWKEMFMAYPNLETLGVQPLARNEEEEEEETVVDNINELLTELVAFNGDNPNKLHNLKHLDIFKLNTNYNHGVRDKDLEQTMKLNFKLEKLKIRFNDTEGLSYSTLGKYITKLSRSLKTLKIKSGWRVALTAFPPVGGNVETTFPNLSLLGFTLSVLSSNNVGFLKNTPQLKHLVIGDSDETPDAEPRLFFNTITLEPLPTLHRLLIGVDILTEDCIRKISEWFPNLSEFEGVLDDKLLWSVYKFLAHSVEVLKIIGQLVTDAGITGIRKSNKKSSKSKGRGEPSVKRLKVDEKVQTIPGISIGQMKKLHHLTLKTVDYSKSKVDLTDDCVYDGLFYVTDLKYLEITFGMIGTITDEALRDLSNHRNTITVNKGKPRPPRYY